MKFLGHSLSAKGFRGLQDKAVRNVLSPKKVKVVGRSLGTVLFYGRFFDRFSQMTERLHALKRKNAEFVWRGGQQA
jgi:hypothetical protein